MWTIVVFYFAIGATNPPVNPTFQFSPYTYTDLVSAQAACAAVTTPAPADNRNKIFCAAVPIQ